MKARIKGKLEKVENGNDTLQPQDVFGKCSSQPLSVRCRLDVALNCALQAEPHRIAGEIPNFSLNEGTIKQFIKTERSFKALKIY